MAEPSALMKHLPLGSMVVDAAMIITLVFSWGQMTESMRDISSRLSRLEQPDRANELRFAGIDSTNARQDAEAQALRREILAQLQHIQDKVDNLETHKR